MKIYKLLFSNQSEDTNERYELVRETKMYVFLRRVTREPQFIFRVHKVTLSVKGIKEGENGYRWDVPNAKHLILMN